MQDNPVLPDAVSLGRAFKKSLRFAVAAGLFAVTNVMIPVQAQDERRDSLAGERTAERAMKRELPPGYNIRWGPTAWTVSGTLRADFSDNVTYTEGNRRGDVALVPELRVSGLWPLTERNTLTLGLGVGYTYSVETPELTSDSPLVSPDSELALQIYAGDFRVRVRERFSYQESLYYWGAVSRLTGEFINVSGIGKFGRLENTAGFSIDWDMHDLVLTLDYEHNNFYAMRADLDHLSRASERLALRADFYLAPTIRAGAESKGSWNDYERDRLSDHWRFSAGPFVEVAFTPYSRARVGAGYDLVALDFAPRGDHNSHSYYAYAHLSHAVNKWLTYSLRAGHEYQLGWSTANAETTSIGFEPAMQLVRNVDLSTFARVGFIKEQGGPWTESYTYVQAGLRLIWRFARRWSALGSYEYTQKDSNRLLISYYQNRVSAGLLFRF